MFWLSHALLLYTLGGQVIAISTAPTGAAESLTCPFRTVNYLTHTLPQQCLASSRITIAPQVAVESSTSAIEATTEVREQDFALGTPGLESTSETDFSSHSGSKSHVDFYSSVTIVTATEIPTNELIPAIPEIIEEDSPLENSNFLSFEEWRAQNLKKSGQSEHAARGAKWPTGEGRKRPSNMHGSLDSLGDDAEIDLDFSGFVPEGPDTLGPRPGKRIDGSDDTATDTTAKQKMRQRTKDAGTTCKERFNYASFDCAASVLKTNREAKSPNSVLMENKDSYMLNACAAQEKFIILELCNDLQIDTIVLANFEFFSSSFRLFQVSVSDNYPQKLDKWKSLGTFEARNTREVQAFLVEDPVMWTRYVRIDFLTHYGSEYYCPVSLVRVHGTNMMEDWKKDQQAALEDDEEVDDAESAEADQEQVVSGHADTTLADENQQKKTPISASDSKTTLAPVEATPSALERNQSAMTNRRTLVDKSPNPMHDVKRSLDSPSNATLCLTMETYVTAVPPQPANISSISAENSSSTVAAGTPVMSKTSEPTKSGPATTPTGLPLYQQHTTDFASVPSTSSVSTASGSELTASVPVDTPKESSFSNPAKTSSTTTNEKHRPPASSTQSQPASPTMQESFFKSVQKRLQMLESNSSLSLQYIEEQSKQLRDAFRKVEQRQLVKTTAFLDHLNVTVLNELREFRLQYDQLWQSTVIELEVQRERYERENQAMHARLGILADELIFQKRISILQMFLIIVCLGLVLFSRGVINNYLELPIVQSVLSKSPSTRWMSLSGEASSNVPPMQRTRSAHVIRNKPSGILKTHRRMQSNESNTAEMFSATETDIYSPPTPVSYDGFSDAGHSTQDESKTGLESNVLNNHSDVEFDPSAIKRPSTSPPMLVSPLGSEAGEGPSTPRVNGDLESILLNRQSIDSRLLSPNVTTEGFGSPALSSTSTDDFGVSPRSSSKQLKWNLPDA